ncbi:MAG: aminopeptidase P N-terminal domain-containing protein [Acholeplasmatales bacterium]|nr:aminopeptidase P N-terminal domain-containing protein [Acholeplasmatales bacterium]
MDSKVFELNRKKIINQMDDNSIFLVFSREKEESLTNERYNVNRNFYYATGVLEFGDILVLGKINNNPVEIIFINPYDEFKAKWVGAPLSKEKIYELSNISDIRYLDNYDNDLEELLNKVDNVYLDIVKSKTQTVLTEEEALANKITTIRPNIKIINGRSIFANARTVKSVEEIEEIKKAIEITKKGIEAILSNIGEMYEYQIESYFDQAIKYYGATGYAFPTIAASGKNATCLHYSNNDSKALNGDLILFDLGASYNMYCSDISRTFPISGKFTERQKELYNIVLNGQKLVFDSAKPGLTTKDLNNILIKYYAEEFKKIGLIQNDTEVSRYYYHGVSHHMGLDCHDLCDYGPLKPGCVISNEPGLYIEEEGIGIRIEDDILITETGAEWLSPQIIKTVEDIEEFIAKNRKD